MDHIDGMRNFVGDLDVKIFHALDIKEKWNTYKEKSVKFDLDCLHDPLYDSAFLARCSGSENELAFNHTCHV